ncbi:MAG: 3-hydroxyacyl-CoA dehydrogenase [Rhodospirillales bacterium]|nr:3-hydroxyacyl-CoA dehydrogenase [Rhodospirillales bacterium]
MAPAIAKAAVLGAGVMGAGIAAQIANAGIPVRLLDIVPEGTAKRNVLAESAIAKMLKADPAPFMHPKNAKRIEPGNFTDDWAALADCDWIVEAVIEKSDIKRDLYRRLEAVRKPGSIVSSNTSTIPLSVLLEGLPAAFAADFLITHFFNPPRYMRLLEIVAGPQTRPEAAALIADFADHALGKTVIQAKDTPGFIGNRIGVYWLQCALAEAQALNIAIEDADAVLGKPMGIPKTGIFGLLDLVGIDLSPHVVASMLAVLPADDGLRAVLGDDSLIKGMIAQGLTGRKGKGGFYRLERGAGGAKTKLAIDLATGQYRPSRKPALDSLEAFATGGPRALLVHDDVGGRYAWAVMAKTLCYAAQLAPAIADSIADIDAAMRLGYNWKHGPFEMIDRLGAAWFAQRLQAQGLAVPALIARAAQEGGFYRVEKGARLALDAQGGAKPIARPPGVLLLDDIKRQGPRIAGNGSASLWDIGDGVACFEVHTKMNALDRDALEFLGKTLAIVPKAHRALVLYNEGANFSVGANLGIGLFAANIALWGEIEALVRLGQDCYRAMRAAPFPVVGAPSGLALGGGCEMLLHCTAVQAHAETYVGLVEVGVGVVPAWGGCAEMLARWQANPKLPKGPMPAVARCFEILAVATVAKSAAEAKDLLFLKPGDGITMNRDRLLADAKAKALALVGQPKPPEPAAYLLPGPSGQAALALAVDGFVKAGKATPHDVTVSASLAAVLCGDEADPTRPLALDDLLALERREFMRLVRHPKTLARIESMLETGKPARN